MAGGPGRIALGVQYDGSRYNGWQLQSQPAVTSVQQQLERALQAIATVPVRVHCAGRTDAGVHATGQVVHFDCAIHRPLKAWVMGSNSELPTDISVQWATPVPDDFHARFSATARRYQYVIHNTPLRSALMSHQLGWHRLELDHHAMHSAAQALLGEQDFSAFRAAGCQSRSPWRCVHKVSVVRHGKLVVIDIQANAFLLHMVRNITGSLIAVGDGRRPVHWIEELLHGRDRTRAAATAGPDGLYLVEVSYPSQFGLPGVGQGLPFLP